MKVRFFTFSTFSPTLLFVALALLVLLIPLPASSQSGEVRRVTLDARQFEYMPGRLEVNQGDTVIITLMASDVTHGFYLDGYGLEQRVTPGMSQEITFIADQPGKFRYRCSVSCGPLHPFMIGELVVNANFPFWRSVALVAVTLTGTIIYLWRYERNSS
ncbi:MAG: cupredoxin domain-containing protein [Chloroflexi bacterium]|nr:cupredoxin domain-containing protein [Chloroflexota bacterium]